MESHQGTPPRPNRGKVAHGLLFLFTLLLVVLLNKALAHILCRVLNLLVGTHCRILYSLIALNRSILYGLISTNHALAFYAEGMGLTAKYLSTVVKASSGKSAVEWIEKYVTLDAIAQLTSTERTIKQIAYDLNFPSQSLFGKYFARVVGMSPQAYRAKHRR